MVGYPKILSVFKPRKMPQLCILTPIWWYNFVKRSDTTSKTEESEQR